VPHSLPAEWWLRSRLPRNTFGFSPLSPFLSLQIKSQCTRLFRTCNDHAYSRSRRHDASYPGLISVMCRPSTSLLSPTWETTICFSAFSFSSSFSSTCSFSVWRSLLTEGRLRSRLSTEYIQLICFFSLPFSLSFSLFIPSACFFSACIWIRCFVSFSFSSTCCIFCLVFLFLRLCCIRFRLNGGFEAGFRRNTFGFYSFLSLLFFLFIVLFYLLFLCVAFNSLEHRRRCPNYLPMRSDESKSSVADCYQSTNLARRVTWSKKGSITSFHARIKFVAMQCTLKV
jgi:hypothetical protein